MPDINYWLGIKYGLLQQNADADKIRANAAATSADAGMINARAGANLDYVRAGLLPAESRANIGLTNAQAVNAAANAAHTSEETKYIQPLTLANIGLIRANTGEARARSGYLGAQTTGENILNRMYHLSDDDQPTGGSPRRMFGGYGLFGN